MILSIELLMKFDIIELVTGVRPVAHGTINIIIIVEVR